jgi:hypothetical protein
MNHASPGAFLALWNSLDRADARREYEDWHAIEHVPERVGLPGFLWGRRYVTGQAWDGGQAPGYFTLYGLQGLQALETAQYADVIARPTPWSERMRPRLSDFVRRPCELLVHAGASTAAHLVTLRTATRDLPGWTAAATQALAEAEDTARLVHACAGAVPPALDLAYPVGGELLPEAVAGQTTLVVLAGHCTAQAAREGMQWLAERLAPWCQGPALLQSFVLQSQVARSDLPQNLEGRLPPRSGPMARHARP